MTDNANETFTDWNDEDERFQLLRTVFDVRMAKEFLRKKPRATHPMEIRGVSGLVGRPPGDKGPLTIGLIRIDWEKALSDAVSLEIPVIICEHEGSYMPIDGWHRIAKAKAEGKAAIKCVVLNKTESKKVTKKLR